jgi:hypothetical protein
MMPYSRLRSRQTRHSPAAQPTAPADPVGPHAMRSPAAEPKPQRQGLRLNACFRKHFVGTLEGLRFRFELVLQASWPERLLQELAGFIRGGSEEAREQALLLEQSCPIAMAALAVGSMFGLAVEG